MACWSLVLSLSLICCGACYFLAQNNDSFIIGGVGLGCCVILYALIFHAIALDWYSKKYRKSGATANSCDDTLRLEMSKCIDEMSVFSSYEHTALKKILTTTYMNITIMISFWLGIIGTTFCCVFWYILYNETNIKYLCQEIGRNIERNCKQISQEGKYLFVKAYSIAN